ncbi:DUF2507 domain-containing protein [Lacticaseibacillus hulanensis]|uniref:DUF2507 domain-containing protein n=1 Tax=Lacticaseibacillus hulanensis TaxID=2493111 RepID=UPI0013E367EE|nr:DUF2507 domain-containing protein [Lacticaseibacillus hulanensis]
MAEPQYTDLMHGDDTTPLFGQLMLRDVVLPDLLGEQASTITYFAGRDLAMRLPVPDDQIPAVFSALGLGSLQQDKMKLKLRTYTLTGTPVNVRLQNFKQADFQFEAGLLAQLIQQKLGMTAEATSTVHGTTVTFTVGIDPSEEQQII